MGDRIAILGERSTIRQIDTPERILAYPVDDFVDDFIGTGSTIKGLNFLQVSSLKKTDYPSISDADPCATYSNADSCATNTDPCATNSNSNSSSSDPDPNFKVNR